MIICALLLFFVITIYYETQWQVQTTYGKLEAERSTGEGLTTALDTSRDQIESLTAQLATSEASLAAQAQVLQHDDIGVSVSFSMHRPQLAPFCILL